MEQMGCFMWLWGIHSIQSDGFAPAFYDAYREAGEIEPGYSQRRDLYNLYHLLNHLNLFGRSYYGAVMRIVMRY